MEKITRHAYGRANHLTVKGSAQRMHIRIPRVKSDSQYLSVLEELGRIVNGRPEKDHVVIELQDVNDLTLSLTAVLHKLKEDFNAHGRVLEVTGLSSASRSRRCEGMPLDVGNAG